MVVVPNDLQKNALKDMAKKKGAPGDNTLKRIIQGCGVPFSPEAMQIAVLDKELFATAIDGSAPLAAKIYSLGNSLGTVKLPKVAKEEVESLKELANSINSFLGA